MTRLVKAFVFLFALSFCACNCASTDQIKPGPKHPGISVPESEEVSVEFTEDATLIRINPKALSKPAEYVKISYGDVFYGVFSVKETLFFAPQIVGEFRELVVFDFLSNEVLYHTIIRRKP